MSTPANDANNPNNQAAPAAAVAAQGAGGLMAQVRGDGWKRAAKATGKFVLQMGVAAGSAAVMGLVAGFVIKQTSGLKPGDILSDKS